MSPAARADFFTAFVIRHNADIVSKLPVQIVAASMSAKAQQLRAEQKLLAICHSLDLFSQLQALPQGWRSDASLVAMLAAVRDAASHNITSDAHMGQDNDWTKTKDRATAAKNMHAIEYTVIIASITRRFGPSERHHYPLPLSTLTRAPPAARRAMLLCSPTRASPPPALNAPPNNTVSAHEAKRLETLRNKTDERVKKGLAALEQLVPQAARRSWPKPNERIDTDTIRRAIIDKCDFPWRVLDGAFRDRVKLFFLVNR